MTSASKQRLLLVHAHPDDETLTTGGIAALYAARGAQVTIVTCTLGEEGEIIPEDLRHLSAEEGDQLGGYRIYELYAACDALGVTDHRFLGAAGRWRDSGMTWHQPGQAGRANKTHPRAFATGNLGEQVAALERLLQDVNPQVVVTYASDGGYGHPDHIRAHDVTMAAVANAPSVERVFHIATSTSARESGLSKLAESGDCPYPLTAINGPSSDEATITTSVDVYQHLSDILDALRAHRTQVETWANSAGLAAYALSNGVGQPVLTTEHFNLVRGPVAGCETDLFGGL